MTLSKAAATQLVRDTLFPDFLKERERLDKIDNWYRWNHDAPHQPAQSTREYKELRDRAQTPWLRLVVTSVAQQMYVDGYRPEDATENAEAWRWWQANGMDSHQIAVHRAALAYGLSYATVLPGDDPLTGADLPVIKGYSPRRMMTWYRAPAHDEWPEFALQADPQGTELQKKWRLRLYDAEQIFTFDADAGMAVKLISTEGHDLGVCPVVRYANDLDLEGRADGEVEPFIPVAGRIDQTVFDRLVVQRFGAWVVRTISGMTRPDSEEEAAATKLRLRVEDILVGEDPDTKFGSLPATPLDGFIKASEADIKTLAAVSQTPVHELLGEMINLSAEALAAARASLTAKVEERKNRFGESHEQVFRLASHIMGDTAGAQDRSAQVRWRDTEIRSLAQAADALGKLATMLGVPVEVLWERVPGFTQQDVEAAKAIVQEGDSFTQLATLLDRQAAENDNDGGF